MMNGAANTTNTTNTTKTTNTQDATDAGDLFSRNWAFIPQDVQQALDASCIFAAGAGLTSTIAVLACRTGFGTFILADGDQVENSNLNRQAFFRRQIGENKAVAAAELLREIRHDINVTVLPEYIEDHSYRDALGQAREGPRRRSGDRRQARARGHPRPCFRGWAPPPRCWCQWAAPAT